MGVLDGKVAVITGGTRGLGLSIAQAFIQEGASVVVGSRSEGSVTQAVQGLQDAGGRASGIPVDVSDIETLSSLAQHALDKFGSLDVWVNNAGLSCPTGATVHVPDEKARALMNTNIFGVYNGSRIAMQHFLTQGHGKLINISGKGDKKPFPLHNPYASAKAWEHSFTTAMAEEYKDTGVGVYLFNPGLVESDMFHHLSFVRGYEQNISIFKVVARLFSNPPHVAAEKAVWLASSATDGKTGLYITLIGPGSMLKGIGREIGRRITRRPKPEPDVKVTIVEPALPLRVSNGEKFVYSLADRKLPDTIGGKASNIKLLYDKKFRVPESYFCTWKAYQAYLSGNHEVIDQLEKELEAVLKPDLAYAVRSSANVEDSLDSSFAGQFESVLDARGAEQVTRAIQSIWDTVQTERVESYLDRIGGDIHTLNMGVIIQRMVNATHSGVSFSKNPLTALDEVIVEAVRGRGTALVQEGETPFRWVNKWGGWIEKPEEESGLPEEVVQTIVDQTRQIAKTLQREIDLEWVYDGQDLYWIQVRDITSIAQTNIYSNRMAKEMTPGMVQPLVWSVTIPIPSKVWVDIISEVIGDNGLDPASLMKAFHYRAYHNMGVFGRVFEGLGLPNESLEMMMGIIPPGSGKPPVRPGPKTFTKIPRLLRFARGKWKFADKAEREYPQLAAETALYSFDPDPGKDEHELIAEVDQIIELNSKTTYNTIVSILLMQIYNGILRGLLNREGVDFHQFDLTEGMDELQDYDPNVRLASLSRQFNQLEKWKQEEILEKGYPDIESVEGIDVFRVELKEFFDAFGYLSDSTGHFGNIPWRETPDMILRMIADFEEPQEASGEKVSYRDLNARGMRATLLNTFYNRARQFRLYREKYSAIFTCQLMLFRSLYFAIGERLAQKDIIDTREQILFLTDEEVRAFISGEDDGSEFRALIRQRELYWGQCQDSVLPQVIFGDEVPAVVPYARDKLTGTPTSRGYYTGRVRVIRGVSEFHKVTQGDVLVIPYSDVSWTPLFAKAGAVVAESGGILSHSSIIAREYNIPAVVSVTGVMELSDDTSVTIDGFRGEILVHGDGHTLEA